MGQNRNELRMFLELHPCESNPVFYLDLKGFLSMIIFKKINGSF